MDAKPRLGEISTSDDSTCTRGVPFLLDTFESMHARCTDPTHPFYPYYGARGISVCPRWSGRFGLAHFIVDMGLPPENTVLRRIRSKKPYSQINCHWRCPRRTSYRLRPTPPRKVRQGVKRDAEIHEAAESLRDSWDGL